MIGKPCLLGMAGAVALLVGRCASDPMREGTHCDFTFGTLCSISSAVKMYQVNHGRLPTEAEGLSALVKRPASLPPAENWSPLMDKLPVDAWGHAYQYRRDRSLKDGFGLYSLGPDGISATLGNDPDDRNTWDHDKPRAGLTGS
ncbi:MAG: gspG [Akkermansiaceae bacterium]|nr:gspG [Akkermansiaceae bacterium]